MTAAPRAPGMLRRSVRTEEEPEPVFRTDPYLWELATIRKQRADLAAIATARSGHEVAAARAQCVEARSALGQERARHTTFAHQTMSGAYSAGLSRRELERMRAALAASGQRVADAYMQRRRSIDALRDARTRRREAQEANRKAQRNHQKLDALLEQERASRTGGPP